MKCSHSSVGLLPAQPDTTARAEGVGGAELLRPDGGAGAPRAGSRSGGQQVRWTNVSLPW